jgi:hypothetical protein
MAAWDELKVVLARLCDEQPRVLMGWPNLVTDHVPPFSIRLASWATVTAAELHQRFGGDVELTVGALPYPPGRPPRFRPGAGLPPDLLDPQQVTAELDGPAVVRSGHTLWHGLLVGNLTRQRLTVLGHLTAMVVDPQTGQVAGGFAGAQALARRPYRVAAGATERISLLIGTDSFTPELGYILPPGSWGLHAPLTLSRDLGTRSHRRLTPVLPLTITA